MPGDSHRLDTPFTTFVCGIPISTFTATCASALFYIFSVIVMLSTDCKLNRIETIQHFAFLIVAIVALIMMASLNMLYTRYRFNCLSLTMSFIYSGSATLILFSLIYGLDSGICYPKELTEKKGVFYSKSIPSMAVWFMSLIGLAFQIVAHYYYG